MDVMVIGGLGAVDLLLLLRDGLNALAAFL